MFLSAGINQSKSFSQFGGETRRIVSVDRQAAASFRAIDCEGADNSVPAGLDRLLQSPDVCRTVATVGEEMKGRTIVPNVIGLGWRPFGYVGSHPLHIFLIAEASPRGG
jgi:hypothetical protein